MENILEIRNVSRRLGNSEVLLDVNFTMRPGEICAVLGESGSGKTTLLRAIAGFETVDKGEILHNGELISSGTAFIQPERRNIGIVFQDYALFPHLTVAQNIAFGMSPRPDSRKVDYYMQLLSIDNLAGRLPQQLSGGQQQRVAIARSLAAHPSLLLLDEPFSNLDESLKWSVRHELKKVFSEEKTSCLLVTHDMEDALEMADHLVVLHNGTVEQQGTPDALYQHPASEYIARLFGPVNILSPETASALSGNSPAGEKFVVRPEKVAIKNVPGTAKTVHSHFKGARYEIHLEFMQQFIVAYSPVAMPEGESVTLHCEAHDLIPVHA